MAEIISQIDNFILELEPLVRMLLVGLFLIFGILCTIKVVKLYVNAKSFKFKLGAIIFALLFFFIAYYIAKFGF